MGNLLNKKESFIWTDVNDNKGLLIDNFNSSINEARKINDKVYCPEEIYHQNLEVNNIIPFLWTEGISFDLFKTKFNWITADQWQTLMHISYLLGSATPLNSNNWTEFNVEFLNDHNSMIGFYDSNDNDPLVHDIPSFRHFHSRNVSNFSLEQRKKYQEYFKNFYVPTLKSTAAEIRNQIHKGQVSPIIDRLDAPTVDPSGKILHHEQIHVHLKTNKHDVALYLDGRWKHNKTNYHIPIDICHILIEWGFNLPSEYYKSSNE